MKNRRLLHSASLFYIPTYNIIFTGKPLYLYIRITFRMDVLKYSPSCEYPLQGHINFTTVQIGRI